MVEAEAALPLEEAGEAREEPLLVHGMEVGHRLEVLNGPRPGTLLEVSSVIMPFVSITDVD